MDFARAVGGSKEEIAINCLALEMQLECDTDKGVIIDRDWSETLARGFGVSSEFFLNLDRSWQGEGR